MYGLKHLLSPYNTTHFMADFWGEKALHIVDHPKKFDGLFGWRDIQSFLQHGTVAHPQTKLVFEKKILPPKEVSKDKVNDWMKRGATLVLNYLDGWHPRIHKLITTLHQDMNGYKSIQSVGVNGYVSEPQKQGFECHYDTHDVFIVQVQGKKSFTIYGPTIRWPLERDKSHNPPETPYLECVLAEGDVLYIPKGHWHYAMAIEPSIHLTIGPAARTGEHYLEWLKDELLTEEFFRKDFPSISAADGGGIDCNGNLESHLRQLQEKMSKYFESQEFVGAFIEKWSASDNNKRQSLHGKWLGEGLQAKIEQQARHRAALLLWQRGSWANTQSRV